MIKVQILGVGCPKCKLLTENTLKAIEEAGIEAEIEKIEDLREIIKFNVLTTPGLVINGELKSAGRVLSREEITAFLTGEKVTSGGHN